MERDPYAKFAGDYDTRWARFTARTHAWVRARLPADLADKHILDLGCGTGTLIASILAGHPGGLSRSFGDPGGIALKSGARAPSTHAHRPAEMPSGAVPAVSSLSWTRDHQKIGGADSPMRQDGAGSIVVGQ